MPKFSVIIPVYNAEKYIDECVQSVLNQTFSDFEMLLIDDGSKDHSTEICERYAKQDRRVRVIHKKNGGASSARNLGLDYACGKYIIFLDSDDYWNDINALACLNDEMADNTDIIVFGCTDFFMSKNTKVVTRNGYDLDIFSTDDRNIILHYLFSEKLIPGGPTIFAVSRSLIEKNNIRFKEGIQAEDYDYVFCVFLNSVHIKAVNNPFYIYRKDVKTSVTSQGSLKIIKGIEYTIEKWLPVFEKCDHKTLKGDYLNYLSFIYTTGFVIMGALKKSERKQAIESMKRYRYILKYGYWKKTRLVRKLVKILGLNLFSRFANIYFYRIRK